MILVAGGTVTLTDVTFTDNVAADSPGGAGGTGALSNGPIQVGQGDRLLRVGRLASHTTNLDSGMVAV